MKIQYDETIDEAVATQLYLLKKSNFMKSVRWRIAIYSALLLVSLYFVVLKGYSSWFPAVVGFIAGLIFLLIHIARTSKRIGKNIRKLLIKTHGSDEPIPSEYELSEDYLIFRRADHDVRFKWEYVEKLFENDNDLVIHLAKSGIAVIPKRIFASNDQIDSWLNFISDKTRIAWQSQGSQSIGAVDFGATR